MSTQLAPSRPPDHPVSSHPEEYVARFGLTERLTHWWTVAMVSIALLTGLGLGGDSRSGPMLVAHITAVALIGVGLLAALVLGDTSALLRATYHLFVFDRRDADWVRAHLPRSGRTGHGEWGMFNPGQKVLAWSLTLSIWAVVITGILSWQNGDGGLGAYHGAAVVVAMVLIGSHVFMAVVNPSTRPALAGMVRGRVRRSWAAEHHAGWLSDVDRRSHPRR